ncbi:hypothetical protein [Sulfurimonas sp. HSL3-7]|uniref:hypothetical protein n=1 Tax=Sulfonitrofixus jiaomeiensis TaxID=3131938 RepID=UPI0031F73AA9
MKIIQPFLLTAFLFSFCTVRADDAPRRILLSGITWHEKEALDNGTKLNRYNLGLGYERDYFKEYKKLYYTYHVMLLNDSRSNPYIYLAGSKSVRFHHHRIDTSLGIGGFFGLKNMRYSNGDYHYSPIVGLAPVASVYLADFTLNITYVPGIDFGRYETIGFLYMYAGWEF